MTIERASTRMPVMPETTRWLYSMRDAVVPSGSHRPWQSGHDAPHPSPEPVWLTSAPAINTRNMPTPEAQIRAFNPRDNDATPSLPSEIRVDTDSPFPGPFLPAAAPAAGFPEIGTFVPHDGDIFPAAAARRRSRR